MIEFKGKKVLVTGGTRGIGASIVELFIKSGANVITTGRSADYLKKHSSLDYIPVDFTDDKSMDKFLGEISSLDIEIVVNNAGINKISQFAEISHSDWAMIQKVNVEAPFLICQRVIPNMLKMKRGKIVNVGSIFSHISKEKRASYSTSKFAVVGMTKALALDYAPFNILANVVSPGFVDTELTRTVLNKDEIGKLVRQVPMGRLASTDEIANVVLFLCSDLNTFITGQNILVDGGFTSV